MSSGSAPDVCVIGLGHVGLPTAALLARSGLRVMGVELDAQRRRDIQAGRVGPEPGLAALLTEVDGGLTLAPTPVPSPAYIVAVGTPLRSDGRADLSAVEAAVGAIARVAPRHALVVIESTVPVGTTTRVAAEHPLLRVAVCPERVLPGDALHEIVHNDRVIGGNADAAEAARELLGRFVRGERVLTTAATAELCKLAENASRDVQLAFAHTIAEVARAHDIDPFELRTLVNRHPRVEILEPGIGVGGHCLPVDPWFLTQSGEEVPLVRLARRLNDAVPDTVVARLRAQIPAGSPVALLGLSYKPGTADTRNAPAVQIARALAASLDVVVTDPRAVAPADLVAVSLDAALQRSVWVLLVAHRRYVDLRPPEGVLAIDACGGWR